MCGLFGAMSSTLSKHEVNMVTWLCLLSSVRGLDSTGVALAYRPGKDVNTKKSILYDGQKAVCTAGVYMSDQDTFKRIFRREDTMLLMGHTRAATVGDVNVKNAHPHMHRHIIGCHNGTIRSLNWKEEDKAYGSDSRVLFRMIAEMGLEKALKEVGYGAYALTMVDKSDDTFHIIRNNDRPLWIMYNSGRTTLWYASERRFLEFIKNENQYYSAPEPIPVHKHYIWKIGDVRSVKEVDLNPRPTVFTEAFKGHRNGHNNPPSRIFQRQKKKHGKHGGGHSRTPWLLTQEEVEDKRTHEQMHEDIKAAFERDLKAYKEADQVTAPFRSNLPVVKDAALTRDYRQYMLPGGKLVPVIEASSMLRAGCCGCGNPSNIYEETYWKPNSDGVFFCVGCVEEPVVKEYCDISTLVRGQVIKLGAN